MLALNQNDYTDKKILADTALSKAQKLYNNSKKNGIWIFFFGTTHKEGLLYDALTHIETATNIYYVLKNNNEYVTCLILKSEIEKILSDTNYYHTIIDIINLYSNVFFDKNTALYYCDLLLDYCLEKGRYDKIYDIYIKIVSLNNDDIEKIIKIYESLLDKYEHILSKYQNKNICTSLAEKYMTNRKYDKAFLYYDKTSKMIANEKLGKYIVCEYFYYGILSLLANDDYVGAQKHMNNYMQSYVYFATSKYFILLEKIMQSIDDNDVECFLSELKKYDEIHILKPSEVSAWLDVKKNNFIDGTPIEEIDLR